MKKILFLATLLIAGSSFGATFNVNCYGLQALTLFSKLEIRSLQMKMDTTKKRFELDMKYSEEVMFSYSLEQDMLELIEEGEVTRASFMREINNTVSPARGKRMSLVSNKVDAWYDRSDREWNISVDEKNIMADFEILKGANGYELDYINLEFSLPNKVPVLIQYPECAIERIK